MRRRAERAAVGAVLAACVVAGVAAGVAGAAEEQVTVPARSTAWYLTGPASPGGFESDTLRVAVMGGDERARSYVALDLDKVPADATITGGTLSLPVDAERSQGLADAALAACAAPEITDSTESPPPVDCKVSSAVAFVEGEMPRLTVDLTPLVGVLRQGGVALLPAEAAVEERQTWHVVIEAAELAAEVRFDTADESEPEVAAPTAPPAARPVPFASPPAARAVPAPPAPSVAPAPVEDIERPTQSRPTRPSRPTAAAATVQPLGGSDSGRFAYSAVWLLPLALLAFAIYFGSALTRDAAPVSVSSASSSSSTASVSSASHASRRRDN